MLDCISTSLVEPDPSTERLFACRGTSVRTAGCFTHRLMAQKGVETAPGVVPAGLIWKPPELTRISASARFVKENRARL
jgi:hypothetical protein